MLGFQHALDIVFDWHTTYPPDRVASFLDAKFEIMDKIIRRALELRGVDPDQAIEETTAIYNAEEEKMAAIRAEQEAALSSARFLRGRAALAEVLYERVFGPVTRRHHATLDAHVEPRQTASGMPLPRPPAVKLFRELVAHEVDAPGVDDDVHLGIHHTHATQRREGTIVRFR